MGRSLDADSAVKLRMILQFPSSPLRTFLAASVMGTWVGLAGHAGPLRSGERPICTTIKPTERTRVCAALHITEHTFNNALVGWICERKAHRCEDRICLFVTPLHGDAAECPWCRQSLAIPESGTASPGIRDESSRNQGQPEGVKRTSSCDNADSLTRWKQGEGEGGAGIKPLEPEEAKQLTALLRSEGLQKTAARHEFPFTAADDDREASA